MCMSNDDYLRRALWAALRFENGRRNFRADPDTRRHRAAPTHTFNPPYEIKDHPSRWEQQCKDGKVV